MNRTDYSKWDKIEVSDDEDDTHPNIDTPSLFRWRHQARVERMDEQKKERAEIEAAKKLNEQKKVELKRIGMSESADKAKIEEQLKLVEKQAEELRIAEEDLKKREKSEPWNVDTLSQPKFSKTIINKKDEGKKYEEMTDEEKEQHMKKFVKENETLIKKYGMMRRFDDSKNFLLEHNLLVHEDTANYLVIWCINLEMEEKHELMTHVAHQCICMQYMLELSKQLKHDPRACIGPFFERIQVADVEYKKQFEDEIAAFIGRIEKRAKEKIADAIKEQQEEEERERLERLGPGGLDPADVFETLPKELQECFEKRDMELIKKVIAEMPEEEARYHLKRCVDSGLWVADASTLESNDTEGAAGGTGAEDPIYETPKGPNKTDDLDLD